MLVHLNIRDFAVLKHLDLAFGEGLNTFSGETGAGKSILVNAINLLLGGRASADFIRSGSQEAKVEALFLVPDRAELAQRMEQWGVPFDGEILIQRTLSREGRNKILLNGALFTLQMLASLGPLLVTVSGQHEHQVLLRPETHLHMLDAFGDLGAERTDLGRHYGAWQKGKQETVQMAADLAKRAQSEGLVRFQIGELEAAGLVPGEEETLLEERLRLQHTEALSASVSEVYRTLYEKDQAVTDLVWHALKGMTKAVEIDPRLTGVRKALEEISAGLEDVSLSLRDYKRGVESDPQRLEEVEGRLELIRRMKRKYGQDIAGLLALIERLREEAGHLENAEDRLRTLRLEEEALRRAYLEKARALSERRREAAGRLEGAIEEVLHTLHMDKARFEIRFEGAELTSEGEDTEFRRFGPEGVDRVEFLLSANVGEPPKPLSRIASGGELSRVMLTFKTVLSRQSSVETLLFDEIDAGISGATAAVVGEKLLALARYHQILCITHLPQIASQGTTHFLVRKGVMEGRTETAILPLSREERILEIARLLGGREITPAARLRAEEMLAESQGRRTPSQGPRHGNRD